MRRWLTPLIFVVTLLVVAGGGAVATGLIQLGGSQPNGVTLDPPKAITNVPLVSADNPTVHLTDFRDKIVVLYFGYTFCPDACPMTLTELARAREELGKQADEVQVIMVTVDPERDTPEYLREYVTRFDPSFIGLTGEMEDLREIASSLGIYFEKQERGSAGGYLVDHTTSTLVLNRDGDLRLVMPFGLSAKEIAHDLRWALKD